MEPLLLTQVKSKLTHSQKLSFYPVSICKSNRPTRKGFFGTNEANRAAPRIRKTDWIHWISVTRHTERRNLECPNCKLGPLRPKCTSMTVERHPKYTSTYTRSCLAATSGEIQGNFQVSWWRKRSQHYINSKYIQTRTHTEKRSLTNVAN